MELIETVTVGSGGQASITFSSIAASWTDLLLVTSLRSGRSAVAEEYRIYFNGSNSNLSTRYLEGSGSGSGASGTAAYGFIGVGGSSTSTASTFGSQSIYIPNYASSNYKSFSVDSVMENNATTSYQDIVAGLWSSTAAITSVTLTNGTGSNWLEFSTASLYGIASGSDGTTTVS